MNPPGSAYAIERCRNCKLDIAISNQWVGVLLPDDFRSLSVSNGRSTCVYAVLTDFRRSSVKRCPPSARRSHMHRRQKRTAAEHFWRRGLTPIVERTITTDISASREQRLHDFNMAVCFPDPSGLARERN